MHMLKGDAKWRDGFRAAFVTHPGGASTEVFPKRCSTFPDLHTFLRETRKGLSTQEALSPVWAAVKIQRVHIHADTQAASVTASCVSGIRVI